jgi:hypothetical protein
VTKRRKMSNSQKPYASLLKPTAENPPTYLRRLHLRLNEIGVDPPRVPSRLIVTRIAFMRAHRKDPASPQNVYALRAHVTMLQVPCQTPGSAQEMKALSWTQVRNKPSIDLRFRVLTSFWVDLASASDLRLLQATLSKGICKSLG